MLTVGSNTTYGDKKIPYYSEDGLKYYKHFGGTMQTYTYPGYNRIVQGSGNLWNQLGNNGHYNYGWSLERGKDGSGNDLLVLIGGEYNHKIVYSRDGGFNWHEPDGVEYYKTRGFGYGALGNDPTITNINSIKFGNGIWVMCGKKSGTSYPDNLFYSNDGYNWYPADSPANGNDLEYITAAFCKDTFVIGATDGSIGYSTDGKAWTIISQKIFNEGNWSSTAIHQIVSDNSGTFVAVVTNRVWPYETSSAEEDRYRNIQYSLDFGKTWTSVQLSYTSSDKHNTICWTGDKFVVIYDGRGTADEGVLAYSSDGITWTEKVLDNNDYHENRGKCIFANYYPEESQDTRVPGILKPTVGLVKTVDVSLNYFPADQVPEAW